MIGIIKAKAPQIFEVVVTRKVHGKYLWDHFQCRDSFVMKLRVEMKWSLRCATRPGKKTPNNIQQILTYTFLLSGPLYPNTLSVLWSRRWTLVSLVTVGRLSFDHNKIQRVE